ncbi:MAG TPA: NAD(P)H:quinone oxidoreductase [Gemmatimonadaceae bacterium]|nr:NAD(P)H:quinone oxidoreductase [Gemmatimonadaceae bacterium]
MPKVLVLFYSRTGNTARIADAVAEGARSVRFTEVDVRRLDDLAPEQAIEADASWREAREALRRRYRTFDDPSALADYDALILGSPACHGVMSAELKLLLDQADPLRSAGKLADKVGAAFTSAGTPHGGQETTLWSIMTPMASLGMILVPPGYTDPAMHAAGSPYGATSATATGAPTTDADAEADAELAVARHQGARVARVAEWVRHAKSHEAGHGHHHHH